MTTLRYIRGGKAYEAQVESLPPESVAYLLQYGWAQSLQDCIAGRAKKVADENDAKIKSGELAQDELASMIAADLDGTLSKRMDAIIAGTVGARVGTSGGKKAVTMFDKVAREMLALFAKAKGKKLPKVGTDEYDAILAKYVDAKRDAIQEQVELRQAAEFDVDIDLMQTKAEPTADAA